ncbi:Panacea domain-containing protein [Moraxella catarrhalis]|uniref:Panacea domain-containing protein n=1 Tax=Moraxella catarrhalis TaxID=480 RepID=UPI001EEED80B|nr:type II toxin-antitoxin system antitoxin SocA domain-containing protein [Moraxella catarrhalis]
MAMIANTLKMVFIVLLLVFMVTMATILPIKQTLLDVLYYSLAYLKIQVIITVLYEIVMIIWLFLSHFEKGVVMIKAPYNPIDVANYIVAEAVKREKPVTHLKLQKLLYYVVAKYAKTYNTILINEDIVKWQYGPVVKSVYHYFKLHGDRIITKPIAYLESAEIFNLKFTDVDANNAQLGNDKRLVDTVGQVLNDTDLLTAYELVERTHKEPAWRNFEPEILQGFEPYYSEDELKAATYD